MTDIVPDSVISRIQKLMALTAERGASETEAQLAAEHVQRRRREERYRQRARHEREASRLDQTAYARGQERGNGVGLDRQAGKDKRGRLS